MNLDLRTLIAISRPRFWLYLAGPFIIGYAFAVSRPEQFFSVQFWLYFVYFLLPANLFLYGINDLADTDTDQFNKKKNTYEHGLKSSQQRSLMAIVFACAMITCVVAFFANDFVQAMLLLLLLGLSYAYSCLPFRFKARPFIDSASNILYVVPGVFAYHVVSGTLPSTLVIVAFGFWTAAMHLFSAIPDISADARAKLRTTAVVLGERKSILLCSGLWWLCMVCMLILTSSLISLLLCVYAVLPLLCLHKKWSIAKVYRIFPMLNAVMGFVLFWIVIIQRFI